MNGEHNIVKAGVKLLDPLNRTFADYCLQSLKRGCHQTAFVNGITGEQTTYQELLQMSVNLAAALRQMDVRRGERVGIISENRVEFAVVMLASWFVGASFTAINVLSTPGEIQHTFGMTQPSYIFVTPSKVNDLREALKSLNKDASVIVFDDVTPRGTIIYNALISTHEDVEFFQVTPINYDDVILVLYSSGTTGLPKGVEITNDNLMLYPSILRHTFNSIFSDTNTCMFGILSFSHVFGLLTILNLTLFNIKTVVVNRFTPDMFLEMLEKYKITIVFLVPTLVDFLVQHPDLGKYDLSSLRHVCSGGGKTSLATVESLKEKLNIKVRNLYGSTETGITSGMTECDLDKVGSIGKVMPTFQMKVVDPETEEILGPNQTGELRFKGPLLMRSYIGPKEIIHTAFDNSGYFKTGDIGYYDDDKDIFIIDRIKELIKYKGNQVPPAELEEIIMQHKSVSEVGVVGKPDLTTGEIPVAFVVKRPDHDVTEEELIELVASKVAPYKKLRGGVIFVDSLPKNNTGKLLREMLRQKLKTVATSKL